VFAAAKVTTDILFEKDKSKIAAVVL